MSSSHLPSTPMASAASARSTAALALSALLAALPATAEPVDEILAGEALAGIANPVLVRVLLEGETALGAEQQTAALEQSARGLLAGVETDPEALRKLEASREIQHLFKEDVVASSDAGFEIAAVVADAGVALQKAGRTEARPVLELCIRTLAFVELRSRCARSLAATDPERAVGLVIADVGGLNTDSSLVVLGDLAAEESLPEGLRRQAFDAIVNFTQGFKRVAGGEAAVEGLRRSGWPEAVPVLQKLTKGFMNALLHVPAQRALLIDFGDRSIVPLLEKKAKRGSLGSSDDSPKWEAARVLIEAGEPSGFEWARRELSGTGSDDLTGPIVTGLAASGTPEALDVLRTTKVKPGKPKAAWVALGLLRLGDASRADEVRRAIREDPDDWRFVIPQMAVALAEGAGDGSGVPAIGALYAWSSRQQRWSPGKIALAALAGNRNFLNDQEDKIDWLNWVKLEMIDSLAAIGGSAAVPVLAEILADREPLIGASAALALARVESPAAPAVLVDALAIDFGDPAQNRVLRSEIAVRARARFGAEASGLLDALASSGDPSLEVLAAALR